MRLFSVSALFAAIGLIAPAAASAQACFGPAPTFGCTVNRVVGPCIGTPGDDLLRDDVDDGPLTPHA